MNQSDVFARTLGREKRGDDQNRNEDERHDVAEPNGAALASWNVWLRRSLRKGHDYGQEHGGRGGDDPVYEFHGKDTLPSGLLPGKVQGASSTGLSFRYTFCGKEGLPEHCRPTEKLSP